MALFNGITLHASEREMIVCGGILEPLAFWSWSQVAPEPIPGRFDDYPFINPVEFVTGDNKVLRGFKFSANDEEKISEAKGYVLMAMGNAMSADRIIPHLHDLAYQGYDVYVYNYRGYADSEGKRRIHAIIEDYKELVQHLNGLYKKTLLYGVSLGGVVMMNVIGSGLKFDYAVIDSSPSRLSGFGCPVELDPVNNLPENAQNILIITGKLDTVLKSEMTAPLREEASKKGAVTIDGEDFSHPFMDRTKEIHDRRMKLVTDYLAQQKP